MVQGMIFMNLNVIFRFFVAYDFVTNDLLIKNVGNKLKKTSKNTKKVFQEKGGHGKQQMSFEKQIFSTYIQN